MKYVAVVEIEFETDDGDPINRVHDLMLRVLFLSSAHTNVPPPGIQAEHYHIIKQPRELK